MQPREGGAANRTSNEPGVLEPEGNAPLYQRPIGRGGYTERHCVRTVEQREPDPATPTAMPAPRGAIQVDAARADVPIDPPYRGDRQTAVRHGQAELGASIHTRIAGETLRVETTDIDEGKRVVEGVLGVTAKKWRLRSSTPNGGGAIVLEYECRLRRAYTPDSVRAQVLHQGVPFVRAAEWGR